MTSTISEASAEVAACPDTDLILAGYSQGAIVVHQAELRLKDRNDTDVLNHIVGTLLVADCDRVRHSHEILFGSAPSGGRGIQVALHGVPARDVDHPAGTVQVCDAQDIVCDFSIDNVRSGKRAAHATAVHTGYLDHDKHSLNLAVDWLRNSIISPLVVTDRGAGGLTLGRQLGDIQTDRLIGPLTVGCPLGGTFAARLQPPLRGFAFFTGDAPSSRLYVLDITGGGRTTRGLAVGDSVDTVLRAYPGSKQQLAPQPFSDIAAVIIKDAGHDRMWFVLDRLGGKVTRIDVPTPAFCD